MRTECYECTRHFDRADLLPLQDLFAFIPGEPDPVGICPRCGGLCLPAELPSVASVSTPNPDAAALAALNFMLMKSLP